MRGRHHNNDALDAFGLVHIEFLVLARKFARPYSTVPSHNNVLHQSPADQTSSGFSGWKSFCGSHCAIHLRSKCFLHGRTFPHFRESLQGSRTIRAAFWLVPIPLQICRSNSALASWSLTSIDVCSHLQLEQLQTVKP